MTAGGSEESRLSEGAGGESAGGRAAGREGDAGAERPSGSNHVPSAEVALRWHRSLGVRLERAYRAPSLELLRRAAEPGSPQYQKSARQIRFLIRRELLDRTHLSVRSTIVTKRSSDGFTVREQSVVRPRYLDEATHLPVRARFGARRLITDWLVARSGGGWTLFSSRVISSRAMEDS
jgi:hypothetical protein